MVSVSMLVGAQELSNSKQGLKSEIAEAIFNMWIVIWLSTVFVFSPSFIHCSVADKGLVSCAVRSLSQP